jgi:platelet-activating factor acetylhydrolase
MTWLERPLSVTAKGYAKFLGKSPWLVKGIVYLFGRNLYLATNGIDQPLKGGERTDEKEHEEKFPVVIFSHGLSGNRTTYSSVYISIILYQGFHSDPRDSV